MIEIFECRFITLYCSNDTEPIVQAEVTETYREFRALLVAVSDGREGYASVFRTLSDLHALLQMLIFRFHAGIKKKRLSDFYLRLAVRNTEAELELLEKRRTNPELFLDRTSEHRSKMHLSKTCTQSNLMELISSLDAANVSVYKDGADSTFLDLVEGFEWLFNIKFNNCYEMRRRIAMRKTQKTPFLDKLRYVQTQKMNL